MVVTYKLRSDKNTLWLGLFIPISTVTLSIKTIKITVHSLMTEELDCAVNKKLAEQNIWAAGYRG